jgi:hypothetical protein
MKLNINKYQDGGGMPFVVYQPTVYGKEAPQTTPTKKESDKEEKGSAELLSKEIRNEVIKKGLPNDVNQFLKELEKLEATEFNTQFDRNKLYSLASKANRLIYNANLMDSALKQAYDNDGLEELAVTETGQIYTSNINGEIRKVSLKEFEESKNSMTPLTALTVNYLSKARANFSELAFDTEIISTIQNSLGINKISDQIIRVIDKIGKETSSKEGFYDKKGLENYLTQFSNGREPTDAETKGIQELRQIYNSMGKEGIYKVMSESSTQRNHLSNAFEYLWALLPNNSRNVLKARHVVDGTEASNPANILRSALMLHTSESSKQTVDFPTSMNKEEGSGSSTQGKYNQSPLEKLVYADLDVRDDIIIRSDDNADYGFKFKGSLIGALPTLDGKWINKEAPLGKVLQNSVWGVIDKDHVYFGDQKLQMYDLDKVMYDGKNAAHIWVPVDSKGAPNYSLLKNYQNGLEKIKKEGVTDPGQMNQIMQQMGAGFIQFDNTGKIAPMSKHYLKPFLLIHGATTTGATFADNNTISNKLSGDINKRYKEHMKATFEANEASMPTTGWFTSNDVVQAPILIALSPSATNDAATFSGKGSLINQNTVAQDQLREPQNLTTSSQYLF